MARLILSAIFWLLTTSVLGIPAPDSPPSNLPVFVNLRIEGLNSTIFEAPILTRGHNVTTASGGDHHCDGTNNNENPEPGPTCTSALDDASHLAHFPFDGTYWEEFDDFFITSIGTSTNTATQFWGILLNFQFTPVGGCQQIVKQSDDVLWAFDAFSKVHFLKLTGPNHAQAHVPVKLTVVDGSTGEPISNATVGGQTTGADGTVSVTFANSGLHTLKAERDDSIRSNALEIFVSP